MNQEKITDFTELNSWKIAHQLTLEIYKSTEKFPKSEIFGLTSQIRRSASSVSANIAEGFGRKYYAEKIQFYYIAHGSLTETKNHLILAKDLKYILPLEFDRILDILDNSQRLLQGLLRKTKTFLPSRS